VKLAELDASFLGEGGCGISSADGSPVPRREGVGVHFDCPCRNPDCAPVFVAFANPLDGGLALEGRNVWNRSGSTIESLTLMPSIQRVVLYREDGTAVNCAWHGFITNGEVITV
jgi:hypothetical protein